MSICSHSLSDEFRNPQFSWIQTKCMKCFQGILFWYPDHLCQPEYIHLFLKYFLKGSTGDGSPTWLLFRIACGTDITHTLMMTQLYWRWSGLINSSCEATFFFFLMPCHVACGILVPWPGIEPVPFAVKVWSLYWSAREVTSLSWLVKGICPAGEIASVPLLVSSITKSVPGELRSQLWPERRNNNKKNHTETQHLYLPFMRG